MTVTKNTGVAKGVLRDGDAYRLMCARMNELALRGPHIESLMLTVANAGELQEVIKEIKSRRVMRSKFSKAGRVVEDDTGNVTAMPARRRRADRKAKPRRRRTKPSSVTTSGGGSGLPATGSE